MIQIDIETPKVCGLCPCFHAEHPMYCQAVKADKNKKIVAPYGKSRPEWCPLKEQEAKQGKWERQYSRPGVYANLFWWCSVCGEPTIYTDAGAFYQYCPHCGAKLEAFKYT